MTTYNTFESNRIEHTVARIEEFYMDKDFMRSIRGRVFGFVNDTDLVEDVIQTTFLKAYANADQFRLGGENGLRNWLYTIARHTAINYWRTDKRHRESSLDDFASQLNMSSEDLLLAREKEMQGDPEKRALDEDAQNIAMEVIAGIQEQFRNTAYLKIFHSLPYKEIAIVLNTPLGTVRSRVSRAKRVLKKNAELRKYLKV